MKEGETSDGEDLNSSVSLEIHAAALEVFDDVFNTAMKDFDEPLQIIKENRFGLIWRDEMELREKIMSFAGSFQQTLKDSFASSHAKAAQHIQGSTCDMFLSYLDEKLDESLLSEETFRFSRDEIKEQIGKKIISLKNTLEMEHKPEKKPKSHLDEWISKTNLFDEIHIHHSLLCCQLAYSCKDPEHRMEDLNEMCKTTKEHLLSHVYVSYENEHVPKYVMAECGDVIYVSFKGLQSYTWPRLETNYRGEIYSWVKREAEKIPLMYFARAFIQKKRLVFSGHSSGGAIASLVMIFLLEEFKSHGESRLKDCFKCITFGLTPMADSMFKKYVESIPGAKECFSHIVQKDDIIPKLFGALNTSHLEKELWNIVKTIIEQSFNFEELKKSRLWSMLQMGTGCRQYALSFEHFMGIDRLAIFGVYYILDTSTSSKYIKLPSSEAVGYLRISENDGITSLRKQYFINHSFKRYVHEVEIAFLQSLPDLKRFKTNMNHISSENEVSPKVSAVHFEHIGEDVAVKVSGNGMWFVYELSIYCEQFCSENMLVDVIKSSGSEVQTRIKEKTVHYEKEVRVQVKTHFENSKYLPSFDHVAAKTTTYSVTQRQQQLAKYRPCEIIELAYLSALLEKRITTHNSIKMKSIKDFFTAAVSVVPIESLFYAIGESSLDVMLDCCEILSTSEINSKTLAMSEISVKVLENALFRIRRCQSCMENLPDEMPLKQKYRILVQKSRERSTRRHHLIGLEEFVLPSRKDFKERSVSQLSLEKMGPMLKKSTSHVMHLLADGKRSRRNRRRKSAPIYKTNLNVIYPNVDAVDGTKKNDRSCKAPMTLLNDGKNKLQQLCEELTAEPQQCATSKISSCSLNNRMLEVLNGLRNEFETCSTLLAAFMQSQVQIPLEHAGNDKYVNEIARYANSFGLSVWGLLIVPFNYLEEMIRSSGEFGQLVITFSRRLNDFREYMFPTDERELFDYNEKLHFLLGSMEKSIAWNKKYISYSLERQLEHQCSKRNIYYHTPIENILQQWNTKFEGETLKLVPKKYRRLVARWIRWSLMINNLRETLAKQTAVGVIGLVNSGKSKFVNSMFEINTATGTTDQKRTTVPLIYNLDKHFKGLDVIDFPGVDDRDETIPELAKLLLSLTRIVVFVVDYRKAHTESTKQWLSILEKENVPVLVCLTFADRLYAELMGKNCENDIDTIKAGVESQLEVLKKKIGLSENGHQRDFKLAVFAFDNDSTLNSNEGKAKLRKVGLSDELDVGRWIAEKLKVQYELSDLSHNFLKYIESKDSSTLKPCKSATEHRGESRKNGKHRKKSQKKV